MKDRYIATWRFVNHWGMIKSAKKKKDSELPFQTMAMKSVTYKLTGIVTNSDLPGDDLIWWYRERCGKSEEAHSIMKRDLAGGQFPSALFGANAAWWQIMILSFNFHAAMKGLVLGGNWITRRLKAIRCWLINVPGRVLDRSRKPVVRLIGHTRVSEDASRAERPKQAADFGLGDGLTKSLAAD